VIKIMSNNLSNLFARCCNDGLTASPVGQHGNVICCSRQQACSRSSSGNEI